ncbi:MAG: hypothetical protein HQK53_02500 [Oligoflexia bacterium]|nr:hypothetical protein [Oligoflexia bacterium]
MKITIKDLEHLELRSSLLLELFPPEYSSIKNLLAKLYADGGNRAYLACLFNAACTEGKFTFIVSYQRMLELIQKDVNFVNFDTNVNKVKLFSNRQFLEFFLHAHRGNFLQVFGIDKFSNEKLTAAQLERDILEQQRGDKVVAMLSYPPLMNFFCKVLGRENIIYQRSFFFQYLSAMEKFDGVDREVQNIYDTSGNDANSSISGVSNMSTKEIARMAKEKAKRWGLLPVVEVGGGVREEHVVSTEVTDVDVNDVEHKRRLWLGAKSRYDTLLENAKKEEEIRIDNDMDNIFDPEQIQRAVVAAVKAGQQHKLVDELEVDFLRARDRAKDREKNRIKDRSALGSPAAPPAVPPSVPVPSNSADYAVP